MTYITKIVISRSQLIQRRTRIYDDGMILEMMLWDVPGPAAGPLRRLEYALSYGNAEAPMIGYGNAAGKGDHRHYGEHQEPYTFISPERLVADFLADVRAARNHG